jgi:hypothetical protein
MAALDTQVGGSHFKEYAIQPIEYSFHNDLNFLQGNIVKYTTRYKDKNGKEDLLKVIHYAQLLIEFEYPKESSLAVPDCNPVPNPSK